MRKLLRLRAAAVLPLLVGAQVIVNETWANAEVLEDFESYSLGNQSANFAGSFTVIDGSAIFGTGNAARINPTGSMQHRFTWTGEADPLMTVSFDFYNENEVSGEQGFRFSFNRNDGNMMSGTNNLVRFAMRPSGAFAIENSSNAVLIDNTIPFETPMTIHIVFNGSHEAVENYHENVSIGARSIDVWREIDGVLSHIGRGPFAAGTEGDELQLMGFATPSTFSSSGFIVDNLRWTEGLLGFTPDDGLRMLGDVWMHDFGDGVQWMAGSGDWFWVVEGQGSWDDLVARRYGNWQWLPDLTLEPSGNWLKVVDADVWMWKFGPPPPPEEPFTGPIYVNFLGDARHNMVVIYHHDDDKPPLPVHYRKRGTETWQKQEPVGRDFQSEPTIIYHAALSGLEALTEYEFKVGELGEKFWFLTMPDDLSRPVVGAFGADFQSGQSIWVQMVDLVVSHDVDFFVMAGDWVSDDGDIDRSGRWVSFWNLIWRRMVNDEGRMIPFVAGVGNHECKHRVNMTRFFFTDMFAFPDQGPHEFYGVIDFGDYLSLIALDSEIESVANQNQWLQGVLAERSEVQYLVPFYHRPIFPSHRVGISVSLRAWFHSFREAGIRAAFCGHDHAYKRTHELVSDMSHPGQVRIAGEGELGLIEFGDGGLGDKFYSADLRDEWYMADVRTHINHVTIVVFEQDRMRLTSRDRNDQVLFSHEIPH